MATDNSKGNTKEQGEGLDPEQLFNKMMAETEGLVPKGFAAQVEKDFTGSGQIAVTRRMAFVFLERTFRESVENIQEDRKFAVAAAHMAEVLQSQLEKYELLSGWMRAAHMRLLMAICSRKDSNAVIAEAKLITDAGKWGRS